MNLADTIHKYYDSIFKERKIIIFYEFCVKSSNIIDVFFFIISAGGILVSNFSGVFEGPGTLSPELDKAEWNENSSVSLNTLSISFNRFGLAVTLAGIMLLDLEEVHSKSMGSLKGETLGIGWFRSEKVTWVEHSNSLCCLALVGSIVSVFFKLPPDEKLMSGKQFNGRGTVGFVNGVQVNS